MADPKSVTMDLGRVTAYAFAVSAGYTGTAEQFAQDQANFAQNASDVKEAVANMPYIGSNGNWWQYNAETKKYEDSGEDATITVKIEDVTMLEPSETPYVTNSGTSTDAVWHFFIPRGKGIAKIEKTGTNVLDDTYTITYSDKATSSFTVSNGKGITSIDKTSTTGLEDTYTITYNDGSTSSFVVTNGKTAYQSAVAGGYTESEAIFETDLAKFKEYSEQAKSSATNSANSASASEASKQASITAQSNAEIAQAAAESAKVGAESARDTTLQYKNEADDVNTDTKNLLTQANMVKSNIETLKSDVEAIKDATEDIKDATADIKDEAKGFRDEAEAAKVSAQDSETSAELSSKDAKTAANEAKNYANSIGGNITYIGAIDFANLPTENIGTGWEYNIQDAFTTDDRFEVGSGRYIDEGAYVAYTSSGKWSILKNGVAGGGGSATLVIGDDSAESMIVYSVSGNPNITADDSSESIIMGQN